MITTRTLYIGHSGLVSGPEPENPLCIALPISTNPASPPLSRRPSPTKPLWHHYCQRAWSTTELFLPHEPVPPKQSINPKLVLDSILFFVTLKPGFLDLIPPSYVWTTIKLDSYSKLVLFSHHIQARTAMVSICWWRARFLFHLLCDSILSYAEHLAYRLS